MFSKNTIKHILILALGFFGCSSIYLTESTILSQYSSIEFSNKIAVIFANLAMVLGLFIFSMLYKNNKDIKKFYIINMLFSLISLITFFATKNIILMSVCLCLNCLFGTSGFSLGYHLALLAQNVKKEYQGRTFAFGYAIGSILSIILMLMPNKIWTSFISLAIYIPVILINLYLVVKLKDLEHIQKENWTQNYKKYFKTLSIIIILMSLLSVISTDTISIYSFDMEGLYYNSRVYYAIGLIIAGFICDKNKELLDILTLSTFIFYLISIVLLRQNISPSIIVSFSYFLLGFFVIFRTITFINLSSKNRNAFFICCFGPMYHIFVESILAIFGNILEYYLAIVLSESVILGLLLSLYVLKYMKNHQTNENDKIKELSLTNKLSIQEEKVLSLLMQDLTNQEIADKLFLSINTVKNHLASIYKKTGMNKKELREFFHLRTN